MIMNTVKKYRSSAQLENWIIRKDNEKHECYEGQYLFGFHSNASFTPHF